MLEYQETCKKYFYEPPFTGGLPLKSTNFEQLFRQTDT